MKQASPDKPLRSAFVDEFVMTGVWVFDRTVSFQPTGAVPAPRTVPKQATSSLDEKAVTRADHRSVSLAFGAKSSLRKHGKARHR